MGFIFGTLNVTKKSTWENQQVRLTLKLKSPSPPWLGPGLVEVGVSTAQQPASETGQGVPKQNQDCGTIE
jgi:hypothetical protein